MTFGTLSLALKGSQLLGPNRFLETSWTKMGSSQETKQDWFLKGITKRKGLTMRKLMLQLPDSKLYVYF